MYGNALTDIKSKIFRLGIKLSSASVIISKLKSKTAKIGIFGMGYVGLPLMLRFSEVGFKVIGFDIDKSKVNRINDGKSYIDHISEDSILKARSLGLISTTDFSKAQECDALILCVPTPLNNYREPDLSYVIDTLESILPYIHESQIMSLESTTYPGTTDEELYSRIATNKNLTVGENFFLVYSPEREDPGNQDFSAHNIPKIIGGFSKTCLKVGKALYGDAINNIVSVSSTKVAEMTKLLENIHRAVNIGLVNEMKIIADKMGIDIYEVIDAAATKPFGFTPYYPGPGLGGHCIPIDPYYLTWKAREYGLNTRFIDLSGEVNQKMPSYVVEKLSEALNQREKPIKGSKILILGVAYKKNVDDMRESPSIKIMEILKSLEALIEYHDPHVAKFPRMRKYNFELYSTDINPSMLSSYDAVVLCTDHDKLDYEMVLKNSALIIDTRGKYRTNSEKVVKA